MGISEEVLAGLVCGGNIDGARAEVRLCQRSGGGEWVLVQNEDTEGTLLDEEEQTKEDKRRTDKRRQNDLLSRTERKGRAPPC